MDKSNLLDARKILRPELSIFVFLVLSFVTGMILSPKFLDFEFLMSSTSLFAEWGIIALPFTFLLISGEIDVSVASMMTLVACTMGKLFSLGVDMKWALVAGAIIGMTLGLINGLLVTLSQLPSLIITLGTMSLYKGLAQVLVGDGGISGFPKWFIGVDDRWVFGAVPVPFFMLLVLAIAMEIILKNTFFGRKIYAIGTNVHVARYSAVKVNQMKVILFTLLGLFSGIAAMLSMSRLEIVKYTIGTGGELDVITMVLLGGTAFSGGRGSVLSTLLAFLVIVFIRTGMLLAIITGYTQTAVIGALLIVVIILTNRLAKFTKEHS
jgi:rhamnose transport system permease protein